MPAVYPLYSETIKAAIVALNKRNGFSSQAIEEYIKVRNYKVGEVGPHLKNLLPLESLYTPRLVRKAPSRCPSRKRRRNIRNTRNTADQNTNISVQNTRNIRKKISHLG